MTTKPTIVVEEAKRPLPLKDKEKNTARIILIKETFGAFKQHFYGYH